MRSNVRNRRRGWLGRVQGRQLDQLEINDDAIFLFVCPSVIVGTINGRTGSYKLTPTG